MTGNPMVDPIDVAVGTLSAASGKEATVQDHALIASAWADIAKAQALRLIAQERYIRSVDWRVDVL